MDSASIRDEQAQIREVAEREIADLEKAVAILEKRPNVGVEQRAVLIPVFPVSLPSGWPAFQFELKSVNDKKARVFGAFYAGTFYIVWFDLNHSIYSR